MTSKPRPIFWHHRARKDFETKFPQIVQDAVAVALEIVQVGGTPMNAKVLKGFHGAAVLELRDQHKGVAYRVAYTVALPDGIWVLHAFIKKSKKGIETPRSEIRKISVRFEEVRRNARD